MLTAVTDWNDPYSPRGVIVGSGKLSFRLAHHARSGLPNLCVVSREVGGRISWNEKEETFRSLYGRPPGQACAETRGSFSFKVMTEGDQEIHTWAGPASMGSVETAEAPAQSVFVCRTAPTSGDVCAAFLCHASGDDDRVSHFAARLRSEGLTYWLDREQIHFGEPVTQKIQAGLASSRDVIVFLSREAIASGWMRTEYTDVLARICAGNSARSVIPFLLEDVAESEFPALLFDRRRADARDERSLTALIQHLKR